MSARRRLKTDLPDESRVACVSDHWTELIILLQMLVLVTFRDLTFATTKLRPAAYLAIS